MSILPRTTPYTIPSRKCSWKGCNFDSGLELRWAVYFDALGTPWEREPLHFESSDGRDTRPDFRLADLGVIVEVKPYVQTGDAAKRYTAAANTAVERELCRMFVFVIGAPAPGVNHAAVWKHGERLYSFASVIGERLDAYACRRAQEYRAEDAEAERSVRAHEESQREQKAQKAQQGRERFSRLMSMTPEQIAAEYEVRR